jgi:hypothetical protein
MPCTTTPCFSCPPFEMRAKKDRPLTIGFHSQKKRAPRGAPSPSYSVGWNYGAGSGHGPPPLNWFAGAIVRLVAVTEATVLLPEMKAATAVVSVPRPR